MSQSDYKKLEVWKKGIDIADLVYDITDKFPAKENYNLTLQMNKAGVSIPSNVAEGKRRQSDKEAYHFYHISLGSCAELETQLIIANRRKYVDEKKYNLLEEYLNHETRMLLNLIKTLN